MKVSLVVIQGRRVRTVRTASVGDDQLVRERFLSLGGRILAGRNEVYDLVHADHVCDVEGRSKPVIFIDGNAKESISPITLRYISAENQNKYKHLAQASFWKGFKGYRVNWSERVFLLLAGPGIVYVLKIILAARGVTIPF